MTLAASSGRLPSTIQPTGSATLDLALALSQGVTPILSASAPSYAVIGQVATAILQAMPASWFTNDDDYVDSFYTLEKGPTYVNYFGAAKNATISLVPYRLYEQ